MLSIEEQESFMHSIYDVIHIGISINSLSFRIDHLKEKYGEENTIKILNSKMKDEKYSDEMVYPLIKVIYTQHSTINILKEHYDIKLSVLQLFAKTGVNMKIICGKVPTFYSTSRYEPLFLEHISKDDQLIDVYYSNKLINHTIRDYLRQFDRIDIEI